MALPGARIAVAPDAALTLAGFALCGIALGTVSGLTPGLHANNFALLLAAAAPTVPAPPLAVGAAMLAAGVTHTFLDAVPALALGVPDASMAASALPGHRLVVAGRGREALRLSALGSGLAVAVAVPLAVPLTAAMARLLPTLRAHLPVVLAAVICLLLATEPTVRTAVGGALSFALAAALGAATLDLSPAAPLSVGGVLTPLFAGLFGAPVLLDALGGAGVPSQADARVTIRPPEVGASAAAGSAAGAVVGYLPGVSAAVASALALPVVPGRGGPRRFLVATSGANTANTVFALFALLAFDAPRTGVMVALDASGVPKALGPLLAVTALSAAAGFALVLRVGDAYLRTVGRVDPTALAGGVLALLAAASWLFAGAAGLCILAVATAVGLVPPRVGARRVYLMGVLVGPLALGT